MTLPILGAPVESGCYYNPVSNGHGFDVHTHGNQTVIYWYTGDEEGNPRFYFATGEPGAELDLYKTLGGTPADPSCEEVKVGTIRATGNVFAWVLDGQRGGVETVQLIIPTTSGIYYYPPRTGEGITVQEWDGGCVVYFYTCGGWYSCEGVWGATLPQYELTVYKTTGRFMAEGAKTEPCGTGNLLVTDDTVHFWFAADGRAENYEMVKLF